MSSGAFEKAKRKGDWHRILSFVAGQPTLLLPFDLVKEKVGIKGGSYGGIREIEIDKIIGSVNRYAEFDREFLPRQWRMSERWTRVRQSFEQGPGVDPIQVNQVGDAYFVVDGNHRISVAKQLGARTIEAEVTVFEPMVPVDKDTDVRALFVKAEYREFLEATQLDKLRPGVRIEFTRPGRYAVLMEHIEKHRYFRSKDEGRPWSEQEAVLSWYDTVYDPLVEMIRSEKVLHAFPKRTEADLYVWISAHLFSLREELGQSVGFRDAARDYARKYSLPGISQLFSNLGRPPVHDRQGTEALRRLALRLEALIDVRTAAPTYAVPSLWRWPGRGNGGTHQVDPIEFWAECVRTILETPSRPLKSRDPGDWSSRSSVFNLFVRAGAGFDHNRDGCIEPMNGEGVRETGTFMKAIAILPYIRHLGCDVIHLLPIGAIGQDGRKGALGSPYAVVDPYALDPMLAEPLLELGPDEEFRAFVEAAHRLGIRVVVEFVFRTAARDSRWVGEHPEWFYWIRAAVPDRRPGEDAAGSYGSPQFTTEDLDEIKRLVGAGDHSALPAPSSEYQQLFVSPSAIERVVRREGRWIGITAEGVEARIPGAFADWPPDDVQPPWEDVTYLRLYDAPGFDYMAYNTVRMYDERLAQPEHAIQSVWEAIAGILPHYLRAYGIDGAMVDMGHALPAQLKRKIIEETRQIDPTFAFWDEDFRSREATKREGYNAVVGNLWWNLHRPERLAKSLTDQMASGELPLPVFLTPETHNSPRCASRSGGLERCLAAWRFACFLPGVPFVHGGLEFGETVPVNTGLDFTAEAAAQHPAGRLPLYNPAAYAWESERSLVREIRRTLAQRGKWQDLVVDRKRSSVQFLETEEEGVVGYVRAADGVRLLVIACLQDVPEPVDFGMNVPLRSGTLLDPFSKKRLRVRDGRLHARIGAWETIVLYGKPQ